MKKRMLSSVFCLLMALAVFSTGLVGGYAVWANEPSVTQITGTHSMTLPSYDGAVLITAQMKKASDASQIQWKIYGKNATQFLQVDVSDYVNAASYTQINLVYFKYSGKYAIYTGALSSAEYKTSGTDGLSHQQTTSGDGTNVTYGVELDRIDFISEMGAMLQNFGCYEILRKYDATTSSLNISWENLSDHEGELIPSFDTGATWHQTTDSQNITRGSQNENWNVYGAAQNNFSQYIVAKDPTDATQTALKMLVESGDQRLRYAITDTNRQNVKAAFRIYLPSSNTAGATASVNFQATSGYAYQPIQLYKNATGTKYSVKDAEGQVIFTDVPSDQWLDFELHFDFDAQKYIVYYGEKASTEKLLRLSNLVNTQEKNRGYMGTWGFKSVQLQPYTKTNTTQTGIFYMKDLQVGTASSDDLQTLNFSDFYMRDLLVFDEAPLIASLDNIRILNADNPQNGLTLDSVTGSGNFDTYGSKTYENTYTVEWESNQTDVISDTGVVHPSTYESKTVTMTAKAIDPSGHFATKDFTVTVPRVMPYQINGVSVTGTDGITDTQLMGGKTVSAVSLTRYAKENEGGGLIIAALYDQDQLISSSLTTLSESAVAPYSDGTVTLNNPLTLPSTITASHRVKVFVLNNTSALTPLSTAYSVSAPSSTTKIYLCGDSTVSPYDASKYHPQLGWGEKLGEYMNDATIVNKAIPGKSARSFIAENDFSALDQLQKGDWVLVQFGHNDQDQTRPIQAASVHLTADKSAIDYTKSNSYVRYLQMYVDKAREKGANLIFVTSPNRASNNVPLTCNIGDYPKAMKLFAAEKGIPYVDLNTETITLFNKDSMKDYYRNYYLVWGNTEKDYTKDYVIEKFGAIGSNYASGASHLDYTHFNPDGANVMANMVASGIYGLQNPLSRMVKTSALKTLDQIAENPPKMPEDTTALQVTATAKANGVSLSWNTISSAESYMVYRDNALIATVTDTSYDDRYFRTLEDLLGESAHYASGITKENVKQNHTYYVKASTGKQSSTVTAKAATEKFAYFTLADTTVFDVKSSVGSGSLGFRNATGNSAYAALTKGERTTLHGSTTATTAYSYHGVKKFLEGSSYKDRTVTYFGDYYGKKAYGMVLGNVNYTQNSDVDTTGASQTVGQTADMYLAYNGKTDGLNPKDNSYTAGTQENYTFLFHAALEYGLPQGYQLKVLGLLGDEKGAYTIQNGVTILPEAEGADIKVTIDSNKKMTVQTFEDAQGQTLTGANKWATYIADVTSNKGANNDKIMIQETGSGFKLGTSTVSDWFNADGERFGLHSVAVVKTADYIK